METDPSNKIRVTMADLDVAEAGERGVSTRSVASGQRRILLIAGAVLVGIVVMVFAVVLVTQRLSPNRRCWRELRGAILSLGEAPRQGHFRVTLRQLKGIDLSEVTDGDLVEAHQLALEMIQYAVDYPANSKGFSKLIEEGATLDITNILKHLEMAFDGEDKAEKLDRLLELLERRYGR